MFELFEKLVENRDYLAAAALLSKLADLFPTNSSDIPEGFYTARIRFIPLEDCLHVFMLLDSQEDFARLPGDLVEGEERDGVQLFSKKIQLSELWDPYYPRGIIMHFIWVHELSNTAREALSCLNH